MNKKMVLFILIIIAMSSYFYYQKKQQAQQMATPILYGNVDVRSVNLAFQQTGRIETLLVDEGDQVVKGQLLVN